MLTKGRTEKLDWKKRQVTVNDESAFVQGKAEIQDVFVDPYAEFVLQGLWAVHLVTSIPRPQTTVDLPAVLVVD